MSGVRGIFLVALLFAGGRGSAQSVLNITAAYATEITVDGKADPAAEKVVIYDVSYDVETRIGEGVVSSSGNFAVAVKPSLIQGHQLVAVDKNGSRSAPFAVRPARSGPVPSAPAI